MKPVSLRTSHLKLAVFSLLAVFALVTGCANLDAIREFASISTESAEYTRLVTDYVESPARLKRYQPTTEHNQLDRIATERQAQQDRMLLRYRAIAEYMDALGRLAADEAVRYDKQINSLGRAVKEGKLADVKEADAFTAMANVLVRGVTDRWRQKQLTELIAAANDPFQVIVESLRVIVERGFGGDLQTEKMIAERYYDSLISNSKDQAARAALAEWRDLRLSALEAREKAIKSYTQILRKIAQTHQALYNGRNNLSRKELLSTVRDYSKDLRTLFGAVKALERG